jgi:hypothetical protein
MSEGRIFYRPNPAHKTITTEAGPPQWRPDKSACPEDITAEEINVLIQNSVPVSDNPLDPKRYAVRRKGGELQWFRTLLTHEHPDGGIEVHGHPFEPGYPKVPPQVLRKLKEREMITEVEYQQMVKK